MSLVESAQPAAPFQVTYQTNQLSVHQMVKGQDDAWSVTEAKALALVRVQNSGIPGTSYVWEGDTCLWKYWKDFDNRIFFVHKPKVAE